jgi:hypothetical protein
MLDQQTDDVLVTDFEGCGSIILVWVLACDVLHKELAQSLLVGLNRAALTEDLQLARVVPHNCCDVSIFLLIV